MSVGDTFNYYVYTGDDGTTYAIKLSAAMAASMGFNAAPGPPPAGGNRGWAWKARHLRHVDAKAFSGGKLYRRIFPVPSLASALYEPGAAITHDGLTWEVIGTRGESRDGRNAPAA
jgi:hypothetical protein